VIVRARTIGLGCVLGALACDRGDAPGCVRDGDCVAPYVCRLGVCLRYTLDAGTPVDPDGGTDGAADGATPDG
jgi:hypothetical protein